jgi:hypothetical protein
VRRSSPRDHAICCHEQAVSLRLFPELRDEEMKILDDDVGYDSLQALAIGYALTDVQRNIPKAALEPLHEVRPGRPHLPDAPGNRNIEPLRLQERPRQSPGISRQRPNLICCVNARLREDHREYPGGEEPKYPQIRVDRAPKVWARLAFGSFRPIRDLDQIIECPGLR